VIKKPHFLKKRAANPPFWKYSCYPKLLKGIMDLRNRHN